MRTDKGEVEIDVADSKPGPDIEFDKSGKSEAIQRALSELPEQARIMITLRDMEEKSYEEIAEVLNCSMGTVKSRISRSRMQLKEKLEKYLGE